MQPVHHRLKPTTIKYYRQFGFSLLLGTLLSAFYSVSFLVESGDIVGVVGFGGISVFLGFLANYCFSLAKNMRSDCEVAYDDDGIWLTSLPKSEGLIRWRDIAEVKSEALATHLQLLNAAGELLLTVDSALVDFDALRMQVLARVAQAQGDVEHAQRDVEQVQQHELTNAIAARSASTAPQPSTSIDDCAEPVTFTYPENTFITLALSAFFIFMLAMFASNGMNPLILFCVLLSSIVSVYFQLTKFIRISVDNENLTVTNGLGTRSYALDDFAEIRIVDKTDAGKPSDNSIAAEGRNKVGIVRLIFHSGQNIDLNGAGKNVIEVYNAISSRKNKQ